jgi:hypothetical protein
MRKNGYVRITALILLGMAMLAVTGCGKEEHPTGDHPEKGEKTSKADHPKGDHPKK